MNEQLQQFARQQLKDGLSKLEEKHHLLFKRMYSHTDLEKGINQVVDDMPESNLDLAMNQVRRTLERRGSNDHA